MAGTARGPRLGAPAGTPRLRPGWNAYRVTGAAELPPWAVEVALTIERPLQPEPRDPRGGAPGPEPWDPRGGAPWPEPQDPRGGAPGPEPWDPPGPARVAGTQAMLMLRAAARLRWLDGIAEAVAEVETAAGVRPSAHGVETLAGVGPAGSGSGTMAGGRARAGRRLLASSALPGLAPVTAAAAWGHLGAAAARGLPAPLRRWRPAAGGIEPSWRSGAGAVLTCDGPGGVSAQAVVALSGLGNVVAITPPPGGALVLRAWRARRSWGVACGLVLGASTALGLGREAGRVAARARAEGWGALVLGGATALRLARAGSPVLPAPEAAAQAATEAQVAAVFEACLAAGGLDRQPAGSRWTLAVTP